ncbi:acyl carrier protein [Actinokineospora sp. UTMC 2448]|uniref:acyl carrier protein n=1 Tax=Actinokineospora sp. UTMC 2448 TaxID=2268449 RepID=UPI0021645468|nr:acyl carrier protein [Actinokineospora sp. UTMC 2448]UVS80639.1 Acyl carrier protein [Actinokineospora sp. UTMC 2448]
MTATALDKEDLRQTVADVLELDAADVTDEASFVDDLEVDSLMALEVVVVLEKKYGVRLREGELKRISCLDAAYEVMMEKLR